MSLSSKEWEDVEIPGLCRVTVPAGASAELEDVGGPALVIKVSKTPVTELIVHWFPISRFLQPVPRSGAKRLAFLEQQVRRFFGNSAEAIGRELSNVALEQVEESDTLACKALADDQERSRFWVAKAVCERHGDRFFLLHWNGPERYMSDPVVPMLAWFEPMRGGTPSTGGKTTRKKSPRK